MRIRFRMVLSLLTLAAVLFAAGCASKHEPAGGRMLLVASIAPLADFARQVGGSLVRVELMVPPGASPHTYQIRPDQMKQVSRASLLILNGVGLEFWADKVIDAADNPGLAVVRTSDGLPIVGSGDRHHPGGNPHVWLNPVYAIHQVGAIRDALAKADPDHKAQYSRNAARYIAELRELDSDIRARVKGFATRGFIAFHPAWIYFAQEYGLVQAAVIEEWPGKEPPPSRIREIVQTARRLHVKAIFAEPQLSPKAAHVVAEEAGAHVLFLDPSGGTVGKGYMETMRDNIDQLEKALK